MKLFLVLFTCVAIQSCAQNKLLVKNVPQSEVTMDDATCRAQSQTVQSADWSYRGTFMEGAMIQKKQNEVYEYCMIGKGYSYAPPAN